MTKSAPRLGKGLSALIGPQSATQARQPHPPAVAQAAPAPEPLTGLDVRDLPIDEIQPNQRQPRVRIEPDALEQLAASIKHNGLLQPILVRPAGDGAYEIVAGERRWRASKIAGLNLIPAIIRSADDDQSFELALLENLQREDLDPIERATAYQQLVDTVGIPVEQLAQRLGESRSNIANYMRLLKLSQEVQKLLNAGELGMGQARALISVNNPQKQLALAKLAIRRNLSVRQVEALAKQALDDDNPEPTKTAPPASHHLDDVQRALSKALGMQVVLRPGKKKNAGRIVIRYNSLEEFDLIAERIGGKSYLE